MIGRAAEAWTRWARPPDCGLRILSPEGQPTQVLMLDSRTLMARRPGDSTVTALVDDVWSISGVGARPLTDRAQRNQPVRERGGRSCSLGPGQRVEDLLERGPAPSEQWHR